MLKEIGPVVLEDFLNIPNLNRHLVPHLTGDVNPAPTQQKIWPPTTSR